MFGPRILLSIGGILTGLSWVLAAGARSTFELYLTYGLFGGIGTGIIYVGVEADGSLVPGSARLSLWNRCCRVRHGSNLTTYPIASALSRIGYQQTLVSFGVIFAVVGVLARRG